MGFEDDPYRDEDGEPLMDFDEVQSDREQSVEPYQPEMYSNIEDDVEDWGTEEPSPAPPPYDPDKVRPRKRLIKKSAMVDEAEAPPQMFDEEDEGFDREFSRDEMDSAERKRKKKESGGGKGKAEKRQKFDKYAGNGGKGSGSKSSSSRKQPVGYSGRSKDRDGEVKEMWDTIAGGDSEDDRDVARTVDDDNFIDDSGVDPAHRYGSDTEPRSPGDAPQAEEGEEDDEIKRLFKTGKKKKKNEKSPAEIAMLVENIMAELEVTAEEDAELNRQGKPAINKLKKLPLLTEVLSKKQLQQEFLDHGVLTLLKNWLEPLPDGSLPSINIRAAVLQILTDFPIDLEQFDRREQLKKSGLGKVIMFLSKSDEETTSNRKFAKDLVDKWSRPIFNKSTRFEDMRNMDEDRAPYRRPLVKKPANKAIEMDSRDDLELEMSRARKPGQASSRQQLHASRPEAAPMDFIVRPQSKIDPEEVRNRAKQIMQDERRQKMNKKMQQLKNKKKQLQATKLSVEGRGMLKYL